MEPVYFEDEDGNSLKVLEDAGYFFSPNVETETILGLQSLHARPSDILLVTYPKSGTHWIYEIISMLVNRSSCLSDQPLTNIEFLPSSLIDELPSPRVLSTHLPYPRLPLDFLRKQSKIVVCVRNPRDVAVSYYHFVSNLNIWSYGGSWENFFPLFLHGYVPYNSWCEHTDTWLKVARSGKHKIHLVYYEDFHQDFEATVRGLATFLGLDVCDHFLEQLHDETTFVNMASKKRDDTLELSRNGLSPIYRSGRVGDWLSWFSRDQLVQLQQEMESWGLHKNNRIKYNL